MTENVSANELNEEHGKTIKAPWILKRIKNVLKKCGGKKSYVKEIHQCCLT